MTEELLRTAFRHSPVTAFARTRDKRETLVYHESPFFSPAADIPEELENEVVKTGKCLRRELKIVKAGKLFYVDLDLEPVKSPEGKITGVAGLAIDVTASRLNEEKARRLIDSNIIGVFISTGTKITEANDAFLKIIGYSRVDLKKGRINREKITPREWWLLDEKRIEQLLSSGASPAVEKEFFRKDGSRVQVLIGAALLEADPLSWVSFVLDITEQKLLDKRKDDFISMSSHELKTPVTTIKAFAQVLEKLSYPNRQETLAYLNKMNVQINRLTKTINEMLDLSKIRTGKLPISREDFIFDNLVDETVNNFRLTQNTHRIEVSGRTDKVVFADRDRVGQVINNLLSNAVKYSPRKNLVRVFLGRTNGSIVMRVQDYGVGVSDDDQKKIFQSFYRVVDNDRDQVFSGLGIGLFIASEIIRLHGGKLTVESRKGHGSVFTMTIPAKEDD